MKRKLCLAKPNFACNVFCCANRNIFSLLASLILLFGFPSGLYSQQTAKSTPSGEGYKQMLRTDVVPPSPNAASLLAYTNVGNNFAKGTVNLSIPLFDAGNDEIKLPISLNYSYDGFKPSQQVGSSGMGWNLIAGGSISRIPFGHLDDTDAFGNNYKDSYVQSNINVNPTEQFMLAVINGNYDTEPDVYEYSFAGYSGRFIAYKGKFYCMPNNKFKITGGSTGYTIITEDGTRYSFGAYESTSHKVNGESYTLPNYNSTYYLTKIESRSGKTAILFKYSSDGQIEQGGAISQTYTKFEMPYAHNSVLSPISSTFASRVNALRLSSIVTPDYTINLKPGDVREDLRTVSGSSWMLGGIDISNSAGVFLKGYKFKYGYFGSGTSSGNKYLKLKSIIELSKSENLMTPAEIDALKKNMHVFYYYDEEVNYPTKLWANVDVNGYYTGRGDFIGTLVPNIYYANGPDRSSTLEGTVMGALQRVVYPAGGNTHIEYELNDKGLGLKYKDVFTGVQLQAGGFFDENMPPIRKRFVIQQAQDITFFIQRKAYSPYGDNIARNNVPDLYIYLIEGGDGLTLQNSIKLGLESDGAGYNWTIRLLPGEYEARVENDVKEEYVKCEFNYKNPGTELIVGEKTSGLRMKTIEVDPLIGQKMRKEYKYLNALGYSSGSDMRPNFSTKGYTQLVWENGSPTVTIMPGIIYSSTIASSGAFGQTYYYSVVDELQVKGTDTLKTRYSYKDYDRVFNLDADLDSVVTYRKVNNKFVRLTKKEMDYKIQYDTIFNFLRVEQTKGTLGMSGPSAEPPYAFNPEIGVHYQVWKSLFKEREYSYETGEPILNTKEYIYDNNHRNLKLQRNTTSDGHLLLSKYKYPEDYVGSISAGFLNANVRNVVLEEQIWKKRTSDSSLVDMTVTQYDNSLFKPIKIFKPDGVITALNSESKTGQLFNNLVSDTRLSDRVIFTYNVNGQLITQKLKQGSSTSYKYGYASNTLLVGYPSVGTEVVGQIVNGEENELFYEGFEENGLSGNAHSGAKYFSGSYALSWQRPNSKSYMLEYWILQNGVWKYMKQAYTGNITIAAPNGIDDVRIYPQDASVTTYTHYPGIGVRSIISPSAETSYFFFDEFNRLKSIEDDNHHIKSVYDYNYVEVLSPSAPVVQP